MKGLMFQVFPDGEGYFRWIAFDVAMLIVARSARKFLVREEAEKDASKFIGCN